MTVLESCPFCGCETVDIARTAFGETWAQCDNCLACGPVVWPPDGLAWEDASTAWNTRSDGWVSVEDRLPEIEEQRNGMMGSRDVLAVAWRWHGSVIGIACVEIVPCDSEPVWWSGGMPVDGLVTHWMPLPEPPEVTE